MLTACGGEAGSGGETAASAPADDRFASLNAEIDALRGPIDWPEPKKLGRPVDLTGKTIWWIPIGGSVSVVNGFAEGVKEAVTTLGGQVKLCDGKFNPTEIGDCLKQAGEQRADAVITAFIDYAMVPNAFDSLIRQGVPVLVAGVPPTGDVKPSENFAFFDPSPQVMKMYETVTKVGLVQDGSNAKGLWLRVLDSQLTTRASDAGVARVQGAVPGLLARHGRVHHGERRQAAVRGERRPGEAPGDQHAVRAGGQLRAAGPAGREDRRRDRHQDRHQQR